MDALSFKYIATVFALLLVTIIVVMMNYSSAKKCSWMCRANSTCRWRKDSSVTHGSSTFLIICYGQHTRVNFFILTRTYLQRMPGVKSIPVTYYGGLLYFCKAHLFYAIPDIFCTAFFVVLPPLFLLLYPLVQISFLCVDSTNTQL